MLEALEVQCYVSVNFSSMVQLCLPFGCLFLAVSEPWQGMTQIFVSPYIDYAIHGLQMF